MVVLASPDGDHKRRRKFFKDDATVAVNSQKLFRYHFVTRRG
jgi:hypothetical protein